MNKSKLTSKESSLLLSTGIIGKGGLTNRERKNHALLQQQAGLSHDHDIITKKTSINDNDNDEIATTDNNVQEFFGNNVEKEDNPYAIKFTINKNEKKENNH